VYHAREELMDALPDIECLMWWELMALKCKECTKGCPLKNQAPAIMGKYKQYTEAERQWNELINDIE
jgi:hypothetical protein